MVIRKLSLSGFRNYENKEIEFDDGINVIFGENAKGKTNVLEAVCLISIGESFKARRTEEMVKFGNELGKVKASLALENGDTQEIEVMVNGGVVMGKIVNKRKYLIDGVSRRRKDLLGLVPVVIFRPEDVDLVSGSADVRRKFMDRLLVQIDRVYENSITTYEQALKRRNKILDAIRDGSANRYALTFWDSLLIKHGNIVTVKRQELVQYINDLFAKSELFKKVKLNYEMSTISESRLAQYKDAEVAVGYSLVGPHKDDLVVSESERNLSTFGSRGEQRMAVLAMKMGEIYFIEERGGKKALLLLDDIFSELDSIHKQEVLRVMEGRQVIVTTADESDAEMFKKAKRIDLE